MTLNLRNSLRDLLFPNRPNKSRGTRGRSRGRALSFESLESRQMLSITPLQELSVTQNTGEKPQSKVFEYAGQWWTVMPNSTGTWVFRLDGTSWTPTQQISTAKNTKADVKVSGDMAHVLLYAGTSSQLATLQYDPVDNSFEPWELRPQLVSVPLPSSAEIATIEVDSTNRLWVAYDVSTTVEVRYSDGMYTSWSAPITVGTGISSDDISTIVAMPNNTIGVLWSNQSSKTFNFSIHVDGSNPATWLPPEVAAPQWVSSVGGKMADDHVNVAVTSDGTLYAAVKTGYDSSNFPEIALLVRRPNGVWDTMYEVDTKGTRPIVVVSEAAGKLIVAYTQSDSSGAIYYRESPLDTIEFGPRGTLIAGSNNNVTSVKHTSSNEVVFLAGTSSKARGVLYTFGNATSSSNQAPVVSAGPNQTIIIGNHAVLDGTVSDDGLPAPGQLTTVWSKVSGPGIVTFANSSAVDTTATFSAAGTYVLQLAANDGQRIGTAQTTVFVLAQPSDPQPPSSTPTEIAFQDGLFPNVTYAGTRDTKIAFKKKTGNYGKTKTLDIDGSPDIAALLKWDVSAIPTGSIVVSAAIQLNVTNTTKHDYEVYALQRAWDEFSATWNQFASGQPWSVPGAEGSGDHDTTVLGQIGPAKKGLYTIQLNLAGIAAVQAWIDNPAMNHGVIIKDYIPTDNVGFSSREAKKAEQRPKLIINFETAPPLTMHGGGANASITDQPPTVIITPLLTVNFGQIATLTAVVSDDNTPNNLLTILWSKASGPGNVTFGSPTKAETTAQFSARGTYVLRVTVSDGLLSAFKDLTVNVV